MTERSQIDFSVETPVAETTSAASTETTYGGYKTVEELVAAHEALKLAAPKTEEATTTTTETTEETTPVSKEIPAGETTEEAAKEAVTNVGLDWDGLHTEYATNGKLSDETYASLEAKGLPREQVDIYIAGRQAQADTYDNAVYAAAGGTAEYTALIEWAKNNLTDAEKVAFNEAVTSGKAAVASLAVEGLTARRNAKRGTPPQNLLNGNRQATGVAPFGSQAEVTEAMRNPKYKTDPAYREQVIARMAASSF